MEIVETNEIGLAHQSKVQAVLHAETLVQQSRPRLDVESGCTTQASQVGLYTVRCGRLGPFLHRTGKGSPATSVVVLRRH